MSTRLFNFQIPHLLDSRTRAESERTGLSMAEIMRRALDEYLDRMDDERAAEAARGKPGDRRSRTGTNS